MKNAFYKPAFDPDPWGHGGQRRSNQILNFLNRNFKLIIFQNHNNQIKSRYKRYSSGLFFLIKYNLPLKSIKNVGIVGFVVTNIIDLFTENNSVNYFFWEPTYQMEDYIIPYLCNMFHIKIIAIPHNIESLVIDQSSFCSKKIAPYWFDEEIRILKMCNLVVSISREEEWLLNLYGILCVYYPYSPTNEIIQHLSNIREKRRNYKIENSILILGTTSNNPTKQGIITLIQYFIDNEINQNLYIAGYGSEKLLNCFNKLPQNIHIIGSVTQTKLDKLMLECKAVIVYQQAATGSLTKLIEFQIAGIPVIANSVALRSYQNIKGFYVFEDLSQVKVKLNSNLDVPEIPIITDNYEKNILLKFSNI